MATLSPANFTPASPGCRNSFAKPRVNIKNWFVYISSQYNSFFPAILWLNLMYLVGGKRKERLFFSLACSYSAPVLSKPDNKNGSRQGCPLWKEVPPHNKSHYAGSMLPGETTGSYATHTHTHRWWRASKYVTAWRFLFDGAAGQETQHIPAITWMLLSCRAHLMSVIARWKNITTAFNYLFSSGGFKHLKHFFHTELEQWYEGFGISRWLPPLKPKENKQSQGCCR